MINGDAKILARMKIETIIGWGFFKGSSLFKFM